MKQNKTLYLKRKIDNYLYLWKTNNNHKPLLVYGPIGVGKSTSINHFTKNNYQSVICINILKDERFKNILNEEDIIKTISRIDPNLSFVPNSTIIYFEELTQISDYYQNLLKLASSNNYDLIISSSWIDNDEIDKYEGFDLYKLNSMDFEEFMWAKGLEKDIDIIFEHMVSLKPFEDEQYKYYHDLFFDYCLLSGLPNIVSSYIENNSFEGLIIKQKKHLNKVFSEIKKRVSLKEYLKIYNIYNNIPNQLFKTYSKFQITKIIKGARYTIYRPSIDYLENKGIISLSYCLDVPELPLNYDKKKFKIYVPDTGLLMVMLDKKIQEEIRIDNNFSSCKETIYQNIIGECIAKQGYNLYYFKKEDSTLEIDFLIKHDDQLIPIQTRQRNPKEKSLSTLLTCDKFPNINEGIRFKSCNITKNNNVYCFPHFCAFLLKRYLNNYGKENY